MALRGITEEMVRQTLEEPDERGSGLPSEVSGLSQVS
jgi:hypothetical protein